MQEDGRCGSVWDAAYALNNEDVRLLTRDMVSTSRQPSSDSRFVTYIGDAATNPLLDLATAKVELTRFGLNFGDGPDELTELYGETENTLCILVVDRRNDDLQPASAARIAVEKAEYIARLPTVQTLRVSPDNLRGFDNESKIWSITEEEYKDALSRIALGQDFVFDGSTIASLPEYSNGIASLPIFSAYVRAARNGYAGFTGNFASTIVKDVAEIIDSVGGFKVLRKIAGTTYETFSGAKNTAPHIGVIDPRQFSDSMKIRVAGSDNETDMDGSTYVFL